MTAEIQELLRQVNRTAELFVKQYPRWRVSFFDEIDSTNLEARRRIEAGADRPILLVAAHQTAGQGRRGRKWIAAPGKALLFTAAVPFAEMAAHVSVLGSGRETFPRTAMPLHLAASLAFRLRMFGWQAKLKWPNDVLVNERKVAGILCEICREFFLAGVGVNLLQREEDLAEVEDARFAPGSLLTVPRDAEHHEQPLHIVPTLLQTVVGTLDAPWPLGRMLGFYRKWCSTLGQRVSFDHGGERIEGLARGIEDDGALLVETGSGERRAYSEIREA